MINTKARFGVGSGIIAKREQTSFSNYTANPKMTGFKTFVMSIIISRSLTEVEVDDQIKVKRAKLCLEYQFLVPILIHF